MTSYTNLGNKHLHKRHSIMIEGGQVPRAKVMDQTMIDRYLMRGLINLDQYRAGEYLLEQAGKCMWAKGVNLQGAGKSEPGSRVLFASAPFGKSLRLIQDRFGWFHMRVVRQVIAEDFDIAPDRTEPSEAQSIRDGLRMRCLRQALDYVSSIKLGGDPLRKIRRAA